MCAVREPAPFSPPATRAIVSCRFAVLVVQPRLFRRHRVERHQQHLLACVAAASARMPRPLLRLDLLPKFVRPADRTGDLKHVGDLSPVEFIGRLPVLSAQPTLDCQAMLRVVGTSDLCRFGSHFKIPCGTQSLRRELPQDCKTVAVVSQFNSPSLPSHVNSRYSPYPR